MHRSPYGSVRPALLIALLATALLSPIAGAAPPSQGRDDRLDTPLTAANLCGAGAPGEVHFTIAATGDTFPHENIQAIGEAQGYDYLFDHIRPYLAAADLAYTNFDGAMLEGAGYTGYPNFNYNPALAAALKSAGIGLVSTANNHILDRGPEGLDATLAVLERNGIMHHGAVPSAAAEQPRPPYLPITLTRDGASIRLAFLSATWGTNGIPDPYGQVSLLWESNDYGSQGGVRRGVLDAVAQARREADIVIVAAHWGEEYQFYPQPYQVEGARRLAEAGADVILGAQSHTLQPVDVLDTGGRKTLVIYSLANFIASQGAFQDPYFSATSVVFYVGLVREPDGAVRVTGYRYLPTLVVDADTRPAPLPPGSDDVQAHVREIMRDGAGARELPAEPAPGRKVAVCPRVSFPQAPEKSFGGDFAQFYTTLGDGATPRALDEALALFGLPIGPVARVPSEDCSGEVSALTTERLRLVHDPEADWPFRVTTAPIGVDAYRQKYGVADVQRRLDLTGDAIALPEFREFFLRHGGLRLFGYPISGAIEEVDERTGERLTVQYFERARLELAPPAGGAPAVRLGALGQEHADDPARCEEGRAGAAGDTGAGALEAAPIVADQPSSPGWPWWLLAGIVLAGLLGAAAIYIAYVMDIRL